MTEEETKRLIKTLTMGQRYGKSVVATAMGDLAHNKAAVDAYKSSLDTYLGYVDICPRDEGGARATAGEKMEIEIDGAHHTLVLGEHGNWKTTERVDNHTGKVLEIGELSTEQNRELAKVTLNNLGD